jgi:hypothetical protein
VTATASLIAGTMAAGFSTRIEATLSPMELGMRIGLQPELNRDRYEFFDALYRETSVK